MAEGGSQPPVINVQLPAITVHYQEGMRFAGDNVGQKTDVRAAEIGQIVVPTVGNSQAEATELQHDSIPTVFKDSEEEKVKRSSSDKENIGRLINDSKFVDALITLQDIPTSQEQQFMLSECYCQLGRPDKALRCIEALQTIMTSSSRPGIDDVIKLVDNYISDSSHIRALILLSCCAKLYKFDSNPNSSVVGIRDCSYRCRKLIEKMVGKGGEMKVIARDVALKIITDMLRELRSVSGADMNTKADMEAG
uniref:uncharacterized protein LOC120342334 isoform X3 n=1 Tax=Styela clava TaxID=7725 RepID=UPI00193A1ED8|nr:uncharacterized protein LOC120342334 isoform X3 [Styela clava]